MNVENSEVIVLPRPFHAFYDQAECAHFGNNSDSIDEEMYEESYDIMPFEY